MGNIMFIVSGEGGIERNKLENRENSLPKFDMKMILKYI